MEDFLEELSGECVGVYRVICGPLLADHEKRGLWGPAEAKASLCGDGTAAGIGPSGNGFPAGVTFGSQGLPGSDPGLCSLPGTGGSDGTVCGNTAGCDRP